MSMLEEKNPIEIGERLRAARAAAGLTQEQAGQSIGVARTTIVAIENGSRRLRPDEFVQLCRIYKVSANSILHREAAVDIVPRFRRTAASQKDEEATSETTRRLQQLASSYVHIERLLHRAQPFHYPPPRSLGKGRLAEQAEELALELRGQLGLGLRPIEDLIWLVESELGIRVFERPLPSSVAGAFAFDEVAGACVVLNLKHPRGRRTMTLAHELAHFMTDRESGEVLSNEIGEIDPVEKFANRFAMAFLMPSAAVRRRFSDACEAEGAFTARSLVYLARAFHVSTEAMCRRLEQLDLLETGAYEMLRERGISEKFINQNLGTTQQEDQTDVPAPRRLALLVAEAFEKGMLTEGQAADALGVDRLTAREFLDSMAGSGTVPAKGDDV
jgi:Zn-dependent peptidase ImmA (M78 family)/DNA-binding XRE family transcriptional regulator